MKPINEKNDPKQAYLAHLDAEIAKLQALKAAVEGNGAIPTAVGAGNHTPSHSPSLPHDAFFGMSIPEAALRYLEVVGRPSRSEDELFDALTTRGIKATKGSLHTALFRLKTGSHKLVQNTDGTWGLPAWYGIQIKHGRPKGGKNKAKSEKDENAAMAASKDQKAK